MVKAFRHTNIFQLCRRTSSVVAYLLAVFHPCPAVAYSEGQLLLSRSTFIHLAFPKSQQIDQYNFAYLPAGTWLKFLGKQHFQLGKNRLLVHSETGVLGYIREDQLWKQKELGEIAKTGSVGVFKRGYTHKGGVAGILDFSIYFTRGEKYEVVDRGVDSWMISVDLSGKFQDEEGRPLLDLMPGTAVVLKVTVPIGYLKVIEHDGLATATTNKAASIEFPKIFDKSIIDGIAGIEKPCNTQKSREIRTRAGGGFDLEKFFARVGFSADRETEEIEVFPKDKNVTRTYYARNSTNVYRLTQYKDCRTGQYEYSFLKPGNDEVPVTKSWAEQNKLLLDAATGKIKVTCPQQYFAFQDALIEQGFNEAEASFIISKIGRWKGLSSSKCL